MSTVTKHAVTIGGESYTIVTDEPIELINKAVAHLNDMINVLAQQTGKTDPKKLVVLCALEMVVRMQKAEQREQDLVIAVERGLQTPILPG